MISACMDFSVLPFIFSSFFLGIEDGSEINVVFYVHVVVTILRHSSLFG